MVLQVSDNAKGLALAVASSAFVGTSFILKKIGLRRAAKCGASAALLPWPLDKGSISWCISLSSDNLLKNVEEDYFVALQNSPAPV
nr:unnamed protein product [Digitaria exilis]